MKQSYTEQDLIRFIYGEVEICEYFEMDYAIADNPGLRRSYQSLKSTLNLLPEVKVGPSFKSIENILEHSKRSFITSLV